VKKEKHFWITGGRIAWHKDESTAAVQSATDLPFLLNNYVQETRPIKECVS